MASATGVDAPSPSSLLRTDSLPLLDLRLLSQSELFSLSRSSSSQPHGRCGDDDVLIPKIDRSVFNESAGSRKQTYSRLRLAPRNSQFPSSSSSSSAFSRHASEPLTQDTFQVIALLKQLFSSAGTSDDLVPISVHYDDAAAVLPPPSSAVPAVQNVPIHVVLPTSAPEKRKRGRPRKNATEGTLNCGNPLPVSSTPVSYGSVGDGVSAPVSSNSAFSVDAVKRKRGRPRKNPVLETERAVTAGMVSVPISSNAALHRSTTDIFSVPVRSNVVSNGSAREVVPIPVSLDSAFSDDAKKKKRGRPRKNRDAVLCCTVTRSIPVPVSSNAVPDDSSGKIVPVPVLSNDVVLNSAADIAGSVSQGKRKREQTRKNNNRSVPIVKNEDKAVTLCDHAKEIVEKKEELVNVNRNEGVVNLVAFRNSEDPFGAELRRRTEALKTEAELLGFLGGLEGEWGSWRKKKKIVPASELGDTLPRGWKIQISLKRRQGHFSLFCRRYLSPNGQQFVSCKEVFSFLRTSSGVEDAGQSKPGLESNNVKVADKVGFGDGENLSFEGSKNTDVPVSCSRVPITFVSTDRGEQAILLETRNLGEGQIGTDERKPSSLETNDEVSFASIHGKLGADTLTEVCTDRQRAVTATCIDGESSGLVSFSHAEKVGNGSKDEKHRGFCWEQDKVCCMSDKNELDKLDEAIKVGETASSNKKNGNSFEISDGTSIVRCALGSTSPEEPKVNNDPGTGLLASSTDKKMCNTADHQFTRKVEDRNEESTSSHCRCGSEEKCGPVRDVNTSPTSIMTGSACDRSSKLGFCSSSVDDRTCMVSNDVNNISSSILFESKFPNEKKISSGSNCVTSGSEAVTSTKHDRSSGRCLHVPSSNEQSFITVTNSDISNFKMEEPWDDSGFESNVFTSFDIDNSMNKSSFGTVDMSKVDDAGICKGSSDFRVAFGGKDTGMHANPVSCMEQVDNFGGGSHNLSSYETKYNLRDSLVSDRQMEEVKQDGGSLDFHLLGRSDYSQSCNFIDEVNNIFSSSMEESGSKEVKSLWNNEVLHAFDIIDTRMDANAGTNTVEGRSSEVFSPIISKSGETFPKTNSVPGCSSKAENLKLKTCTDIGFIDVPDNMRGVSNSALWEQPRPEDTDKFRNNDLTTGSVNHSQTYGNTTPVLIWRTNEQNFQPSRLVDTSSAPMQLSGCFPNYNILSEKDAYGDLNVNERFEDISDLEGGLGNTKQSQYNFLTAQGTLNSNEPKGLLHAEIKQGFDSSFWLANESLTLFPKTASGHQTVTICIWCRKEFYHQGVGSGTKSDSMHLMCATCQAKFSE